MTDYIIRATAAEGQIRAFAATTRDLVEYATGMYDAVLDADALLLVTEWKEFRVPNWGVVKRTMKEPIVFDGRNIYDKKELHDMGFEYTCIGQ